jgi:hypothetical protein
MEKEIQKLEICDKIFLYQKYFSHNGKNSPPKNNHYSHLYNYISVYSAIRGGKFGLGFP